MVTNNLNNYKNYGIQEPEDMLQYMSDFAGVDYDDVVEFVSDPEVQKLREIRHNESNN